MHLCRISRYIKIFFLNPKIFFKKFLGHILLKVVPSPKGFIRINIGGHFIDTLPSRNDWWKSMYLGYCGVETAHSLNKYLNSGGIFIDVGAGIGYFSAIASDIVDTSGQVHCFEPNPFNIKVIQKMIKSNPNSNIVLNDYALGAQDAVCNYYIQRLKRVTKCSMIYSLIERIDETIEVRTRRLDNYLEQKNIDRVSLVKIDVEGYEYYVLKGLSGFLKRTSSKPPIICEILASAYKNLDFCLEELYDYMKSYGYEAHNIFNPRIRVDIRTLRENVDVLFLTKH